MNTHKRVPLKGSALFRLTSPRRLAEMLLVPRATLERLVEAGDDNYLVRPDRKSGRIIEEPKPQLKLIHQRFARLLAQIETPDYLHSGVKGRSYITNANAHGADDACVKLDIKKFFPSSSSHHVQRFFEDVLEYPPDVASRAKQLLTHDGHLPTGGNASPILSFWAYKPMFDEIDTLARENDCEFTLYVDDMSITGVFANRKFQQAARKIIARYGLRAHKAKTFSPNQPRVLTGIAKTRRGREVPHRRAKGIAQLEQQEAEAETTADKLRVMPSLIGKLSEAAIVDPSWTARKNAAVQRRRKMKASG
ncbi:MAG TPA: hypothetical protein DCX71_11890 [Erythrobacter sp.]|jgi:RNA-directed DNA polymerase|uniref:Uncharacterized protein n=1 Tax=Qipengyuania citrea TaxID=225971 RepID=A0A6I4UFR1_9SPHN|nr:reverse transcriptase family protein [Qipengyuania citrea]MAG42528.1 hypothetical protein [Erythrobacteraceae bacterium]HAW36766.1 hypothetical protein [Erythrobacter sp.]HIL81717.1 RNA-directed DNA polymerase [Myxococcales bacterium]MCD1590985.1 reverse transcriptase family protein [Qipengyuania citrea]MDQ0567065.1 hypothetical protein [Qipengyuania citrea]